MGDPSRAHKAIAEVPRSGAADHFEALGERLSTVDVSVARIKGHLGIGVPIPTGEPRAPDQSRAVTSSNPVARPGVEFA